MGEVIITRKIQLILSSEDKAQVTEWFTTLYKWGNIVYRAANAIVNYQWNMDRAKDTVFLTEDFKAKLADIKKDDAGVLTTSRTNTTYQQMSKAYIGDIPMGIMTSLNSLVTRTYNEEKKDYYLGKKSVRSYRSGMPIPFQAAAISNMREQEKYRNYEFTLHGLHFRTNFGRDRSGNQIIWDRYLKGEYKLCDSSIQIKDNKIFMLAVFSFKKEKWLTDPNIVAACYLDIEKPIVVDFSGRKVSIGDKEEYLWQRKAIQGALSRTQRALRFNNGGNGRPKKMAAIERYKLAEKNYVTTKIHQYTAKLIQLCLQCKAGKIILMEQKAKEDEAKKEENIEFLLRNWSYYQLKDKIAYKANRVGIEVEVQ